ncbi:MAG: hypothetical protein B7Z37_27775 [Verrucomicrobia bacterium 12-59-8]|nr:MAG: hypothetical protein B7Z37_27775 [Verrucomicrobia bacterium 12-59-8]
MNTLRQSTWAIPGLLALTTFTGLILALVAEGIWDWLSWALEALPVLIVLIYWNTRPRRL